MGGANTIGNGSAGLMNNKAQNLVKDDDDVQLKNRNIVLNFGDKDEDEEAESPKEQWNTQGDNASTPIGNGTTGKNDQFSQKQNQFGVEPFGKDKLDF